VVAPASVKNWAWTVAATLAAGFIGLLAFQGERPEPGLARFAPAGILAEWPVSQVTSVEVSAGANHWLFLREPGDGWRVEAATTATTADLDERIEKGLKLLHNSGPQRTDLASEQLAEFGLAPPSLTITARMTGGAGITIEFGNTNPLGLQRFARVVGRSEIMLIPAFVADAWELLAAAR